jgi:hypothetical protein
VKDCLSWLLARGVFRTGGTCLPSLQSILIESLHSRRCMGWIFCRRETEATGCSTVLETGKQALVHE